MNADSASDGCQLSDQANQHGHPVSLLVEHITDARNSLNSDVIYTAVRQRRTHFPACVHSTLDILTVTFHVR